MTLLLNIFRKLTQLYFFIYSQAIVTRLLCLNAMDTFVGSQVVSGVDAEIAGVNMESLGHGFEQFWMVDGSFLHEVEQLVLLGNTLLSEVVQLDSQFVLELSFLGEIVGFISVIEVLIILGQWMEELVFSPGGDSVSSKSGHLDLAELTSSQKVHSSQLVFEVAEVPDSWPPH